MRKELDLIKIDENPRSDFVLIAGQWEENIPWKIYITGKEPKPELCTAAFCVVTYQNRLILVQNKSRGWELPGGHVNQGEQLKDALRREVFEEANVIIKNPRIFGYQIISPKKPIPYRDQPRKFYPFPYSYIPFYTATTSEVLSKPFASEIERTTRVSLREARRLLFDAECSHGILVDYLAQTSQIQIKK